MNNRDIKYDIKEKILNRDTFSRVVSDVEILTRCPNCGDSHSQNTGHLYIRINPNDNFPIVYNCFKCEFNGILTTETLEMLGITDITLAQSLKGLNKSADPIKNMKETKDVYFDYVLPDIHECEKTNYINRRLGLNLSIDEFKRLGVIISLRSFLKLNHLNKISTEPYIAKKLDERYIGFISSNRSYILFRDVSGKEKTYKWVKYKIDPNFDGNAILMYTIPNCIDILSTREIVVNLSEGIMDCISIAYNLGYDKENVLNIAVLGNKYITALRYIISKGIVGSNITINIFSDNDHNNITSIETHRKTFSMYKNIFGEINVIYNEKSKDCGVPLSEISLKKIKL